MNNIGPVNVVDVFNSKSLVGYRFIFKDHGNASYYGIGPWKLNEPNSSYTRYEFIPVENGFSYTPYVVVWPEDIRETFTIVDSKGNEV